MAHKYSGLCVGGPLDGQTKDHVHPELRAVEKLDIDCMSLQETLSSDCDEINMTTYLHRPILSLDKGLWLPSNETIDWAIDKLMTHYTEYSKEKLASIEEDAWKYQQLNKPISDKAIERMNNLSIALHLIIILCAIGSLSMILFTISKLMHAINI